MFFFFFFFLVKCLQDLGEKCQMKSSFHNTVLKIKKLEHAKDKKWREKKLAFSEQHNTVSVFDVSTSSLFPLSLYPSSLRTP